MKPAEATNVVPMRKHERVREHAAREFLPAALEIVETPASPLGRAIAATLILFFLLALAWATFGHIDIIATAQGKVVPTERVKVIQPLEAGIVTAIRVRDGDKVAAGDVLVELDRTVSSAERNRVGHELLRTRLDVARLTALRAGLDADIMPADSCRLPARPRMTFSARAWLCSRRPSSNAPRSARSTNKSRKNTPRRTRMPQ